MEDGHPGEEEDTTRSRAAAVVGSDDGGQSHVGHPFDILNLKNSALDYHFVRAEYNEGCWWVDYASRAVFIT